MEPEPTDTEAPVPTFNCACAFIGRNNNVNEIKTKQAVNLYLRGFMKKNKVFIINDHNLLIYKNLFLVAWVLAMVTASFEVEKVVGVSTDQ